MIIMLHMEKPYTTLSAYLWTSYSAPIRKTRTCEGCGFKIFNELQQDLALTSDAGDSLVMRAGSDVEMSTHLREIAYWRR